MTEDDVGLLVLVLVDVVVAAAIAWTTWAGARARLGPNIIAGIRTGDTMRNEAAWVAGHRAAWPLARLAAALALAAVALALLLWALDLGLPWATGVALAGLVGVVVMAIPIVRVANRAAREAGP